MLHVLDESPPLSSAQVASIQIALPSMFGRDHLVWDEQYVPEIVYVGSFLCGNATLFLFGARLLLEFSSLKWSGGPVTYVVAEQRPHEPLRTIQLSQFLNIVFEPEDGLTTVLEAKKLKGRSPLLSERMVPSWKWEIASWPAINGKPMRFIGQKRIVESQIARQYLANDVDLFLFSVEMDRGRTYAIVEECLPCKTPDELFKEEMMRASGTGKPKQNRRRSSR
jgi:hypothetical protein